MASALTLTESKEGHISGCWEIKKANQVVVATLHCDVTTLAWAYGLRNLIIPGREELRQFSPFVPLAGMPFDHARNTSVQKMFEVGASYLFSLDSDVIPPRDTILRLMAHKLPIVSGMYCRRSPPWSVPVMIKNGQWHTKFKQGEMVDVDLVGAGCLLIHRSVFEKLQPNPKRPEKRWFDWRVDAAGLLPPGEALSEDFTFCHRVRKELGMKVLVDTSIQCKHCGYAESTFGHFKPMVCDPST